MHGWFVVLQRPAIVQALKPEAKLGTVMIACFDDEQETLAAIKQGTDLRHGGAAALRVRIPGG